MKKYLLAAAFLFFSVWSTAQKKSTTIYCRVFNRGLAKVEVDYLHLPKLLSDSLKNALLVQPKREHNVDDVLLRMTLAGWHIVTAEGNISQPYPNSYLLSREIEMSEKDRDLFVQRLNDL